jgi:hypothetical protein
MKRAVLLFLALLLLAYLVWRWLRSDSATVDGLGVEDRGGALVFNRVWIDSRPRSVNDEWKVFYAITEHPVGGFDGGTFWKGAWERFHYETRGDGGLDLSFPGSRDKERAGYKAWKCHEKGFDYCLELSGTKRGARRYYSQEGWEIGGGSNVDALVSHAVGDLVDDE